MTKKLYFIIALLCALAGTATTAQAADNNVTLSVDADIPEGTTGHWYINMPHDGKQTLTLTSSDINAGKKIFKVYDDGGKGGSTEKPYQTGNYSESCDGYLIITVPEGYKIQLSGSVSTKGPWAGNEPQDYLMAYDGTTTDAPVLLPESYSNTTADWTPITTVRSSGQAIMLYFKSSQYMPYAGLNLTVKLIDIPLAISYGSFTGGTVAASVGGSAVTETMRGDLVTLAATPDDGYFLNGIKVRTTSGNKTVNVTGGMWYTNNQATFTMPDKAVTVTPTFSTGGYYINMPKTGTVDATIPATVTSFKVYDDGGATKKYSNGCDGYLNISAPTGYKLRLSGSIKTDYDMVSANDYLTVKEGSTTLIYRLQSKENGKATTVGPVISSGNSITIYFHSSEYDNYDGLDLNVELLDLAKPYTITTAGATGGNIETTVGGTPVTQTTMDQTVTVNASPASGYWLSDICVGIDGSTETVTASGADFISNTATFTMPAYAVTVTPTFTDNPADLYVKMPVSGSWTRQIPTGITSFKVYDDGGADGNYSKDCSGSLTLTAPENCVLMLTGSITTDYSDDFYVFNGTSVLTSSERINTIEASTTDGEAIDIGTIVSTNRSLTLQFKTGNRTYAGLDLTATVIDATHPYAITIDPNLTNGSVTAKVGGSTVTSARVNKTVTLTVTPATDFATTEVSYTANGTKHVIEPNNGTYSFTMPPTDVTVSAEFMDEVIYHWGTGNDGSEEHPYVISNKAGWDLLVAKSASPNYTNDKYFELATDISGVAQSVLYFGGHLDGKGHKITLAMNNITGYNGFGLIWRNNILCFISNLTVDGSIVNQELYVGGFIAQASFPATITNCRSSVAITSSYYSGDNFKGGGFVGFTGGHYITVDRCVFDGSFSSSNELTFSPWVGGIHNKVTNSAYLYDGEAHFYNDIGNGNFVAYHLTLNNHATVVRTDGTTIGNNTGSVYDISGFTLDGNEYYMSNTTVTLGADPPSGYSLTGYSTSTGYTFTGNTFPMSNSDISVTAHIARTDYVNHWQASMTIDGSTAAKAYVITTTDGLDLLSSEVNNGNRFDGMFFRLGDDITYSHETAWNDDYSAENNFTTIGDHREAGKYSADFYGTFDGGRHTISGIRIFKGGDEESDKYHGLFGLADGATIKNIVLADARITGYRYVGGIVGIIYNGIVSGCTVKSDVTVFAVNRNTNTHGGIVGNNTSSSTVIGCTSSARLNAKSTASGCSTFGGIVGSNEGILKDCTAAGVVIDNASYSGAIVGNNSSNATLSGNTYHSCLVGTNAFNIGVGYNSTGISTYTEGDHTGGTLDYSKLWLFDNRDNTPLIAAYTDPSDHVAHNGTNYPAASKSYTLTLEGRTLYRDGQWNTLCLPFGVTVGSGVMAGATAMMLNGSQSSFNASTGELTLNFNNVVSGNTIAAGTPFIVKWTGVNVTDPVFTGVTVSNNTPVADVISTDGKVQFLGTYSPAAIANGNKACLFLGDANTLYWPDADNYQVGPFRAYFKVDLGNGLGVYPAPDAVRQFVLNFGEECESQGITTTDFTDKAAAWYSLDGVKLDGKPTKKGLYIHGGRKVVIP